MDGLVFRYFPGNGTLHRFDPRCKLPGFAFLCFAILRSSPGGTIIVSGIVLLAVIGSGVPMKVLFADFIRFLPLLIILFSAIILSGSDEGRIISAGLATLRFGLVILSGNLLIQTTSIRDISSTVRWYLKPIPFINSGRIATMIGLTVSLIPLFFNELEESKHALWARGLSPRKRPLRWTVSLVRPLLTRLFLATEETAEAMESRCYTDKKTFPPFKAYRKDIILLVLVVLSSAVALLL